MNVYGVQVVESNIVTMGDENVVTWNLPGGDFFPHTRAGVEHSARTIGFFSKTFKGYQEEVVVSASVSADFRYVEIFFESGSLRTYDLSTGFLSLWK